MPRPSDQPRQILELLDYDAKQKIRYHSPYSGRVSQVCQEVKPNIKNVVKDIKWC